MNKHRIALLFILIITAAAVLVDWPTVPIKFTFGPIKINTVLAGPDINWRIFGQDIKRDLNVKLGLDLQGGTDLTLKADVSDLPADKRKAALDSAREVIERRVNLYGVSESVVQTSLVGGDYRIIVELPGVKNVDEAKALVGQTAKLEFREYSDPNAPLGTPVTMATTKPSGITGRDLQSATASFTTGQTSGPSQPVVEFEIKKESVPAFSALTKSLIGKPLAVTLDDTIISYPTVQSEISDRGQITGLTIDQAKLLATQLNAGALPVKKIDIISENTVGATLGQQSVTKSLFAGIVGLIVVGIFMIFFYGWPGVLADAALIIYTMITLSLFKLIPVTLTLAGIAGFILSIGMAVDANVLIFERMKEEMRAGRLRKQAIEIGFSRAWNSIRDSNLSSLITTTILFYFGTGQVRGFALTLALGILVSMFTAITVTRTFLRVVYKA